MSLLRSHPASILQYGHDFRLQQTRTWMLQKQGDTVRNVLSEDEFRTAFLSEPPDLLLLCQTLSAEECERAGEFSQEHSDHTRCILLFNGWNGWSIKRDHVLLSSGDGPGVLVETVRRMIDSGAQHLGSGPSMVG